jgi:hypothetical protein
VEFLRWIWRIAMKNSMNKVRGGNANNIGAMMVNDEQNHDLFRGKDRNDDPPVYE